VTPEVRPKRKRKPTLGMCRSEQQRLKREAIELIRGGSTPALACQVLGIEPEAWTAWLAQDQPHRSEVERLVAFRELALRRQLETGNRDAKLAARELLRRDFGWRGADGGADG
jgi:hypothetical protein